MGSTYRTPQYQLSLAAIVSLLLAATVYAGGVKPGKRIQGGKQASITKYPWLVSLEESHTRVCGGVVISKTWVVTAAHCIDGSKIFIRSSTSLPEKGGKIHQVKRTIVHPKYEDYWLDYDIALVEMQKPFKWSYRLKPATLATKNPNAGTWTSTAGWGILRKNGPEPKILQAADMQIQDWNECRRGTYMTERKICTSDNYRSIAEGDSGGPLTIRGSNELVGISSSVNRWYPPTLTSIFTSIANLRDWIKQETGV